MKKGEKVISICIILLVILSVLAAFLLPEIEKMLYPLEYGEYVSEYSEEYNVPQPLVYAVMQNESGFDKNAESAAGAKGLMQLMPSTFDWLCPQIGESDDDILDPETNIKYGTYLLSWLYDYFGNWETAVAAYNAGHGRVGGWLEDNRYSDDGKTLKEIPLSETSNYVENVFASYEKYKQIYFNGE